MKQSEKEQVEKALTMANEYYSNLQQCLQETNEVAKRNALANEEKYRKRLEEWNCKKGDFEAQTAQWEKQYEIYQEEERRWEEENNNTMIKWK